MKLSAEQLLAIARDYWPGDKESYHGLFLGKRCPEVDRFHELWQLELKKIDRWWDFLESFRSELPGFTLSDITATFDACFRCGAYPETNRKPPASRWVVVGCLSILAPVYTVFGVRNTYNGKTRSDQVFFEPLPPEMQAPADIIARRIEARFEASPLPREIAETPIPLFVDRQEPPNTTLFHALFSSSPASVP
jgi:hypothetical protein